MANDGGYSDVLIPGLTDDVALNCLARVGITYDFGSLSCLNSRFNELIKSGYLYELRKQLGIFDHWLYLTFFNLLFTRSKWIAFDPVTKMWLRLPALPSDEDFACPEKKSIVVGSEFLVFGSEKSTSVIWKYNLVHQNWVKDSRMNYPYEFIRFALSSYGSIAIVAGGLDKFGTVLNTAEMYDSATGKWEVLPNMHTGRRSCSGFFMDGKFYVIGGVADTWGMPLYCGEEFDLKTRKWRKIEGMYKNINVGAPAHKAPLVAVVDNELYAFEYLTKMVKKYDKEKNDWVALGSLLPFETDSMNCSGFSFKAVGDELIMLAKCELESSWCKEGKSLVLYSWSPSSGVSDGRLNWKVLGAKKLDVPLSWRVDLKYY